MKRATSLAVLALLLGSSYLATVPVSPMEAALDLIVIIPANPVLAAPVEPAAPVLAAPVTYQIPIQNDTFGTFSAFDPELYLDQVLGVLPNTTVPLTVPVDATLVLDPTVVVAPVIIAPVLTVSQQAELDAKTFAR